MGDRFRLTYRRYEYGGTIYNVFDGDALIGQVRHLGRVTIAPHLTGQWVVHGTGHGVPVVATYWRNATDAALDIVRQRTEAATVGGALHCDDTGLNAAEKAMLDFETTHANATKATRDRLVLAEFQLPSHVYQSRLLTLIDRPEAIAYAPVTVNRLRRLRAARKARRDAHRPA